MSIWGCCAFGRTLSVSSKTGMSSFAQLKRTGGLAALAVALVVMASCGGSRPEAESALGAQEEEESDSENLGEGQRLSVVSAPPGVVIRFRGTRLPALLDEVFVAADVPFSFRDLLSELDISGSVAQLVDVDGTIEGAMGLNPRAPTRPIGFLSFGVTSLDGTLRALDSHRIQTTEGPHGVHYFSLENEPCAVGPAISGSPARVVCSDVRDNLNKMLPYALRGLPQELLSDAALHLEFDMAPITEKHGAEFKTYLRWLPALARTMHLGNPTFDRALSDGAVMVSDEASALLYEIQTVKAQVFLEERDFRAVIEARFKGDGSQTVKTLRELSKRAGAVPPIFDQLPATASAAAFSHEISKERSSPWWSLLSDLARGGAESEKTTRAFAQQLGRVVAGFGSTGATHVIARGPLVTSVTPAGQALQPAWTLSGTTRPTSEVVSLVDDLTAVLASPELKKVLPHEAEVPVFKKSTQKIDGAPGAHVYSWKLSGTSRVVARMLGAQIQDSSEEEQGVLSVVDAQQGLFAIVEHEGATWMSWGSSEREISEAFRALKSKDAQRLSDLGALDGVRSEPSVSAGYSQLSGVLGAFAWVLPAGSALGWKELEGGMPHRGAVPLTYFFKIEAAQETRATWEFRLPSEFVQDLAALSVTLGKAQAERRAQP